MRRGQRRAPARAQALRRAAWPCLRCRDCSFTAQPQGAGATVHGGSVNWQEPARGRCPVCTTQGPLRLEDVIGWDGEHRCRACGTTSPCPQAAIAVICTGCGRRGLHGISPAGENRYPSITGDRQAWLLRSRAAYLARER